MNCIIDTGGGLRGVYGAGVFDRLLDEKTRFDVLIGVSAGSANAVTFMGGQKERTKRFYLDYAFRGEYMGFGNLLKSGSYLGLDYIYRTLSNSDGEDPLDCARLLAYDGEVYLTATDEKTGEPHYFTKADIVPDDYSVLCASCCIPGVCRPYPVGGRLYYDGGVSDPIPVKKALALGCDEIVVILTRPVGDIPDGKLERVSSALIKKGCPKTAEALLKRREKYIASLSLAQELEKEGKCVILSPSDTHGIKTLTKDREGLEALYEMGYSDAGKIKDLIRSGSVIPR